MNDTITYTPIETKIRFTGDGFSGAGARILKQVKREGDVAIYSRTVERNGVNEGFEVISIGHQDGYNKEEVVAARTGIPYTGETKTWVPAAEHYPTANEFGTSAFHVFGTQNAEIKFKMLLEEEIERTKDNVKIEEHFKKTGTKIKRCTLNKVVVNLALIPDGTFTHGEVSKLNGLERTQPVLSKLDEMVESGILVTWSEIKPGKAKGKRYFKKA